MPAALVALLVQHHVAITSTLLSTSAAAGHEPPAKPCRDASDVAPLSAMLIFTGAAAPSRRITAAALLKRDMELERAFVAAGGLLLAGPDSYAPAGIVPRVQRPSRDRAAR